MRKACIEMCNDKLRAEVERLTKERDEARAEFVRQFHRGGSFASGADHGRAEERAKVVAWLRKYWATRPEDHANNIERGEHWKDNI